MTSVSFQTTDYNLSEGNQPQFVQLMCKLNHISVALPVNLASYPTPQQTQLNKDLAGPYAISVAHTVDYPTEEREKKKPARLFCCLLWCSSDCQGEKLANAIDRKCRFVFPLCFVVFNAIYWYCYTNIQHEVTTKYNVVGRAH